MPVNGHCICYSVQAYTTRPVVVLTLYLKWWTHMAVTKMDNRMRQLTNKDENTANKWNYKKHEWNINEDIEEKADHGHVDAATVLETIYISS